MGDVDTDEFLESVFSDADGRSVDNEEESASRWACSAGGGWGRSPRTSPAD
jgi:hypothetical protein